MKLFGKKIKDAKKINNSEDDFFLNNETPAEERVATQEMEEAGEEKWLDEDYEEGQLSVDVYQTKDDIVIKSTIAGVKPEDIDVSINNDMITIRGKREIEETIAEDDYFYQECYWGGFSRSIILPTEIMPEKVEAALKNGVLTVRLPKAKKSKSISVKVKEND
ncbi:MAG TPA: Hsp20/alpha crystallin family protein [Patescibacteria group bacterium]|nr:Hsp20/alpha crystallin family protein [Patescibacteria group bacterium]